MQETTSPIDSDFILTFENINSKFVIWDGNVHELSQTECMYACTHYLLFLRRRVLRLIMDPSEYIKVHIQPEFSG